MKKLITLLFLGFALIVNSQVYKGWQMPYTELADGYENDTTVTMLVKNIATAGKVCIIFVSGTDTTFIRVDTTTIKVNDNFEIYEDSIRMVFDGDYVSFYKTTVGGDTLRIATRNAPGTLNGWDIPEEGENFWIVSGDTLKSDTYHVKVDKNLIVTDTIKVLNSPVWTTVGNKFLHLTGTGNFFLGYQAGNSTSGSSNMMIGYQAGLYNSTGAGNLFLGYQAGYLNSTGFNNVWIGYESGLSNQTGLGNLGLGRETGRVCTGDYNVFIGYRAGRSLTSGYENVFIGANAGKQVTTGDRNICIGDSAGYTLTTESDQLFITNTNDATPLIYGEFDNDYLKFNIADSARFTGALFLNTGTSVNEFSTDATLADSSDNAVPTEASVKGYVDNQVSGAVSFGTSGQIPYMNAGGDDYLYDADFTFASDKLTVDTIDVDDDVIQFSGSDFLKYKSSSIYLGIDIASSLTGFNNVLIGDNAGFCAEYINLNTIIGYNTGYNITNGDANTLIGSGSGYNITTGSSNVLIGNGVGYNSLTTGDRNVFIGVNAGSNNNADSSIFVGYNAGYHETGSNKLMIDIKPYENEANAQDSTFLSGDMAERILTTGKGVGIEIGANDIVIYTIKKTIITDSILIAYTRPQEIIPAPGAGKIIKMTGCLSFIDYGGTTYATNINGFVGYNGNETNSGYRVAINQSEDTYLDLDKGTVSSNAFLNSAINFTVQTGNPTDGNSPIIFYITYQIIEL